MNYVLCFDWIDRLLNYAAPLFAIAWLTGTVTCSLSGRHRLVFKHSTSVSETVKQEMETVYLQSKSCAAVNVLAEASWHVLFKLPSTMAI